MKQKKYSLRVSIEALFQPGRLPELDGIRAFAIGLVVFTHIFQAIPELSFRFLYVEWFTPLFNGWIGVDLFFALSGFLICTNILNSIENRCFSYLGFYTRRFFRIVPTYYFVFALVIGIGTTFPQFFDLIEIERPSPSDILKNVLFITNYFPANIGIPSWSLAIEEQFYLVAPLMIYLSRHLAGGIKIKLLIGLFFGALVFRMLTYRYFHLGPDTSQMRIFELIYFPFHTRFDGLMGGMLAAFLVRKMSPSEETSSIFLMLTGLGLFGSVFITGALTGGFYETTLQYTLLSLGAAMLIAGLVSAAPGDRIKRLLSRSFFTPIARMSYSVYLIHLIVIHFVKSSFPIGSIVDRLFFVMLSLIAVFAAGLLLFLVIEQPMHRLGLILSRHFDPKPTFRDNR